MTDDPYEKQADDAREDYYKELKNPTQYNTPLAPNLNAFHAVSTRAPNLPYLGATIHLEGFDKCRVALVTGHGEHWSEPDTMEDMAFVTIFAPNLPMQNGVLHGSGWHFPIDCPKLDISSGLWPDFP
jgi:hypothetical protein